MTKCIKKLLENEWRRAALAPSAALTRDWTRTKTDAGGERPQAWRCAVQRSVEGLAKVMPNFNDVAEWMVRQTATGELDQDQAAQNIRARFGASFVFVNAGGNLAINRQVLREFSKLSVDTIVWDRPHRFWRKRNPHDKPGRQQR